MTRSQRRRRAAARPRLASEEVADRNARFVGEAAAIDFRWRCQDCVHVVASSGACSMAFPNGMLTGEPHALQPDGEFAFCKYFELQ